MQFDGFVGHSDIRARISAFAESGRFPHALLIEGAKGSGRRTLARLIARCAVCTGDGERPCGVCPGCRKALAGAHPDVSEYGGDGTARSFHLETVLALRDDAYLLPNEAPRRVFILAEAQAMTERAQNALLKILEEPPSHVLFLLTCENRAQLLPTILSRTVSLALGPTPSGDALPYLQTRLPDIPAEDLEKALTVCGGSIGQTIASLQDGAYRQTLSHLQAITDALLDPLELPLLKETAALADDKALLEQLFSALILVFRDALTMRLGTQSRLSPAPESAAVLADRLTSAQLCRLAAVTEELRSDRLRNMNLTLLLTRMCFRMREAIGR